MPASNSSGSTHQLSLDGLLAARSTIYAELRSNSMKEDAGSKKVTTVRFSADGIRGIAGQWPMNRLGAWRIGTAIREYVLQRAEQATVFLGRDTRPSGAMLSDALVAGLSCDTITVIDLGIMTTPGIAYLTKKHKANLGVIVTASHNPPRYNGVKLLDSDGFRLPRDEEEKIEDLIANVSSEQPRMATRASAPADATDLLNEYVADQIKWSGLSGRPITKLVVDCANGAPARVVPEVFRILGTATQFVNIGQDGAQIGRGSGSEYVRSEPHRFARQVRDTDSDYGLAFDGDGDRLLIVDRDGRTYDGIDILFVLAKYFHSKQLLKGDAIVTSDSANRGLDDSLMEHGIATLRTDNGDRNIEQVIRSQHLLLGGESVGNIIINDSHHGSADPLLAALWLIRIIGEGARADLELQHIVSDLTKYPQFLASGVLAGLPDLRSLPGFESEKQVCLARLGDGARTKIWYSSTEPGRLNVMMEGGVATEYSVVRDAALRLYQFVENAVRSEQRSSAATS